jgi:protease-4
VRAHSTGILLLLTLLTGCRHVLRTDSTISVPQPINAVVTADLQANDRGPVTTWVVSGDPRCCPAHIAVLDVDGLLVNANMTGVYSASENPVSVLREKLDAIARDPCTAAVVLRINSPGGGVAATEIMWHELQLFRSRVPVPMVACLLDVATGGGYYLATAADTIVAYPGTIVGGVGVILNSYNMQDTLAQFNVLDQSVKAGENIDMGSSLRAMSPETRAWLQTMADEYHRSFQETVYKQRPQVSRDDPKTLDGRIFTANQAMQRGLIDQVGTLEDAVAIAGQRRTSDFCVIMYHRSADPARSAFAITSNSPATSSLLPISIPGIERSRLPTFLYLWEPDPTLERAKSY